MNDKNNDRETVSSDIENQQAKFYSVLLLDVVVVVCEDQVEEACRTQVMTREDPVCDHEEGAAELSCQRVTKIHLHRLSPMRACHDHRDAADVKADVGDEKAEEADFERFR